MIKKLDYVGAIGIILIFCVLLVLKAINSMETIMLGYDEAYNATVAANFARYGEYRVSYPQDIYFHNLITTGVTVLLPTAFLFKICGISGVTSALVPLVYAVLSVFVVFMVFVSKGEAKKYSYTCVGMLLIGIFLTDKIFLVCAMTLWGETACLFWVLLCCLGIILFYRTHKAIILFGAGISLTACMLTKSSMIFIFITLILLMISEAFFIKRLKLRELGCFLLGILLSFIILEALKIVSLGGIHGQIAWWTAEWNNMISQSSGLDVKYSMATKLHTIQGMLSKNNVLSIIMLFLPLALYFFRVVYYFCKKKEIVSDTVVVLDYMGIAGSSLLIYFLFLGGTGLNHTRRLMVNSLLLKLACGGIFLIAFCSLINFIWKKSGKKYIYSIGAAFLGVITIFYIFKLDTIPSCVEEYLSRNVAKTYEARLMDEYVKEINALPSESTCYVLGWWQEPNISLIIDRDMVDIRSVDSQNIERENAYFLIGRRFDNGSIDWVKKNWNIELEEVDSIEVDYERINSFNGSNLFTIYRIK